MIYDSVNETETHTSNLIRHLYVHFPFCARICPYCAFYKTRGNAAEVARFCEALVFEATRVAEKFPLTLETIFFGGGTPTVLSTAQQKNLLELFHEIFDLGALREWSIEANPGSVSAKKTATLRESGINRISLGVQSWDNQLWNLMGREHDATQAEESFRIFRSAGFSNISIDLMFALPGQTETQWRNSLQKTIELQAKHISTYCLTYEEDTEFLARFARGEFAVNDETEARFLDLAMTTLESAGYEHYEISNYARPGFRSDHNEYARRLFANESPITSIEKLTPAMKRIEHIALGLRTGEGIVVDTIDRNQAEELISDGLLSRQANRVALTRAGKLLADSVAEELL